jgi:ribosomal protein S18 acetylase RimI-like enzyme
MASVRDAELSDAEAIARVWVDAWRIAYRGLVAPEVLDALSREQRAAHWRARLGAGDPGARTTVATVGAEIAGYCRVAVPSRDADAGGETAEIASLYVAPERGRTGVGRALLHAALERLGRDGWRGATLWVFTANQPARVFYAAHGFAPDGATGLDGGTGLDELRLAMSFGAPPGLPS